MDLLRRRKWWTEEGLPALRILAIEHWDPLNVYDEPTQADVYDPFLERLGRMLRRGKGVPEITTYLGKVRTKAFRRDDNEPLDERFAEVVVDWYQRETTPR
jgi:hypothetical protein